MTGHKESYRSGKGVFAPRNNNLPKETPWRTLRQRNSGPQGCVDGSRAGPGPAGRQARASGNYWEGYPDGYNVAPFRHRPQLEANRPG